MGEVQAKLEEEEKLPDTLSPCESALSNLTRTGWGRLLPVNCSLTARELTEDIYTIGREPKCAVSITKYDVKPELYRQISKVQCRISRSQVNDDEYVVFLEDLSSNGTFVNRQKVGKGEKMVISSDDEISFALADFKVFVYIDSKDSSQWMPNSLSRKYHLIKHLGAGGFAEVKLVLDKKSCTKLAMKRLNKTGIEEKTIINEIQILRGLKHIVLPSLLERLLVIVVPVVLGDFDLPQKKYRASEFMKDLLIDGVDELNLEYMNDVGFNKFFRMKSSDFEKSLNLIGPDLLLRMAESEPCIVEWVDVDATNEDVFIIMEYVPDGNLLEKLQKDRRLSEPLSKLIFAQLVWAVRYMHEQRITHRDIKPENILISVKRDGLVVAKIADFGLAKIKDTMTHLKTACGTLHYTAPEVLSSRGEQEYTSKVDLWALGAVLYVCLTGRRPFTAKVDEPALLINLIMKGAYSKEKEWKTLSLQAKLIIHRLLTVNPNLRYDCSDLFQTAWMKDPNLMNDLCTLFGSMNPFDEDTSERPTKIRRVFEV